VGLDLRYAGAVVVFAIAAAAAAWTQCSRSGTNDGRLSWRLQLPMSPSSAYLIDVLHKTKLFSGLTDAELEALANRTSVRSCGAGEMLFSEGEDCAGLYVVAAGRVRIFKTSKNGREQVLAIEGPVTSIAELPVFDGGVYPASVSAIETSELLFISRKDFQAVCLEHPEVALKVLRVVGVRLRRLVGLIEELSFSTVRHRLISWILRQARAEGDTFILGANHQELAGQIGTVRELVSRNLARLQAQGLIAMNGRELTVLDTAGLEAELAEML
jgi:CRP/FNR family transcriptional regulator